MAAKQKVKIENLDEVKTLGDLVSYFNDNFDPDQEVKRSVLLSLQMYTRRLKRKDEKAEE